MPPEPEDPLRVAVVAALDERCEWPVYVHNATTLEHVTFRDLLGLNTDFGQYGPSQYLVNYQDHVGDHFLVLRDHLLSEFKSEYPHVNIDPFEAFMHGRYPLRDGLTAQEDELLDMLVEEGPDEPLTEEQQDRLERRLDQVRDRLRALPDRMDAAADVVQAISDDPVVRAELARIFMCDHAIDRKLEFYAQFKKVNQSLHRLVKFSDYAQDPALMRAELRKIDAAIPEIERIQQTTQAQIDSYSDENLKGTPLRNLGLAMHDTLPALNAFKEFLKNIVRIGYEQYPEPGHEGPGVKI